MLPVIMQSTPRRELFSLTWRDLIDARVSIGLKPEFSARANGTASSASANARMAYCSMPGLYRIFGSDQTHSKPKKKKKKKGKWHLAVLRSVLVNQSIIKRREEVQSLMVDES